MQIRFSPTTALAAAGAVAIASAGLTSPALAGEDADKLAKKVHKAYQAINQYEGQTEVQVKMEAKQGRSRTQNASQSLAFDRDKDRMRLDTPASALAVQDGKLKMTISQHKAHHLEKDTGKGITYTKLQKAAPMAMQQATIPEFAMMTEDEPAGMIGNGKAKTVETDGKAKGLAFPTDRGQLVLHVNPDTHLIEKTVKKVDLSGSRSPLQKVTITYNHSIETKNESIDESTFALDTSDSKAVNSMRTLMPN